MFRTGKRFFLSAAWMMVFFVPCAALAGDLAMPAGTYRLDPRHTSVTFKISHLGFSHFTGRFDRVSGILNYNPDAPERSSLDVTIDAASIDTNDGELDEDLQGPNWFDAHAFPQAHFHADHVDLLGADRGKITGEFTLHGVTRHLTLDTILVGAGTMPLTGEQVMGFSAKTEFDRSLFGIDNLEPMVGDEVTLQIETEFDKEP